jgi:transcriptional regulator with XRE-family HTH domain
MDEIGKKIRKLREEKNMHLADLAKKLGITSGYLSKLETGKKPISIRNIVSIASALDVDVVDLFTNKEKVYNPFTGEEDWLFVVEQLKARGFSPGDVYLKFAQEAIEKDKKGN